MPSTLPLIEETAEKIKECFGSRGDTLAISIDVRNLPACLGQFQWLKHLTCTGPKLSGEQTSSIPWIVGLENLETLELRFWDPVELELVANVCKLQKLQTLSLCDGDIECLPPEIGNLNNLQRLSVCENKLTGLPDQLRNILNLKHLNLIHTSLGKVPEVIKDLKLESLRLYCCNLTALPSWIGDFPDLKELDLSFNSFNSGESLPDSIGNLKNLVKLRLENTEITTLPDSIGELENLERLWLDDAPISRLPESMGRLSKLQLLSIHRTQLLTVPDFLGSLPALRTIRMQSLYGGYQTLPVWLARSKFEHQDSHVGYDITKHLKRIGAHIRQCIEQGERSQIASGIGELCKWADHALEGEAPNRRVSSGANLELGRCLARLDADRVRDIAGARDALFRLALALEQAIAHPGPEFYRLEHFAQELLKVAGPEVTHFYLGGIRTPRDEIEALASPTKNDPRRAALEQIFERVRQGWGANVHERGYSLQGARLLAEMRRRLGGEPPPLEHVETAIRSAADARPQSRDALLSALDRILSVPKQVTEGDLSTTTDDTLRVVWTYISRQTEEQLRDHLTEAFFSKLLEIKDDETCNTGCVQRLLQTTEGIDHSLLSDAPDETVVKGEMLHLAGEVNNDIEEGTRFDYNGEDPDPAEVTRLKQDLIRAHIEARFIGFKRIDREWVQRVANPVIDMVKDL